MSAAINETPQDTMNVINYGRTTSAYRQVILESPLFPFISSSSGVKDGLLDEVIYSSRKLDRFQLTNPIFKKRETQRCEVIIYEYTFNEFARRKLPRVEIYYLRYLCKYTVKFVFLPVKNRDI